MYYSPGVEKGKNMLGSIMEVIKGKTRSLDHGSYALPYLYYNICM